MLIDLSYWYRTSLPPKIELIQGTIEQHRVIRFTYFAEHTRSGYVTGGDTAALGGHHCIHCQPVILHQLVSHRKQVEVLRSRCRLSDVPAGGYVKVEK